MGDGNMRERVGRVGDRTRVEGNESDILIRGHFWVREKPSARETRRNLLG